MTQKRPTLADVAKLAGLSPTAASLILNNRPGTRLSPDAAERVRAAAETLGYRPNVAARGLRTAKTNTIGFISDDVTVTRFASGQIRGALRAAEAAGHVVLVVETGDDPQRESRGIEAVLDRQVDGIIFAAVRARSIELPPVPPGTRVVLLNLLNPAWPASVRPAEFEGGRTAVATMVSFGHDRDIVLVGQNAQREGDLMRSEFVEERVSGIFHEMAQRGLRFEAELAVPLWTADDACAAVEAHLAAGNIPRCILVLNDPMAFGVYRALANAGLRIPEDVSVISFDNDEIGEYLRPALTTVALPYETMGEEAVRLLLSNAQESIRIEMPVVLRDSLGPPRP